MSLKTEIVSRAADLILSESAQEKRRSSYEKRRKSKGHPHRVRYFHDARDPYAHLCLQALASIADRYDVLIQPRLVSPPAEWAAPERAQLEAYSLGDASRLAEKSGLSFSGEDVTEAEANRADRMFAAAIEDRAFLKRGKLISAALWADGQWPSVRETDAAEQRAAGDMQRKRLGHYLGATFHYGDEWYWGVDRLHHLETRLQMLGALKPSADDGFVFDPPKTPLSTAAPLKAGAELDFFCSFRSPYTYIATERVRALADAYGAKLNIRFVLPMVMRGLPVPKIKGRYITADTAREARRHGIPFGRIADPVGKPVERGYAIFPWAIESGLGYEFALSFMRAVWSEGVDAGSDKGLQYIVERAGLDWAAARDLIGCDEWRPIAESNRVEMVNLGLWGVPSFRVGEVSVWGQDRLWVVEEALAKLG